MGPAGGIDNDAESGSDDTRSDDDSRVTTTVVVVVLVALIVGIGAVVAIVVHRRGRSSKAELTTTSTVVFTRASGGQGKLDSSGDATNSAACCIAVPSSGSQGHVATDVGTDRPDEYSALKNQVALGWGKDRADPPGTPTLRDDALIGWNKDRSDTRDHSTFRRPRGDSHDRELVSFRKTVWVEADDTADTDHVSDPATKSVRSLSVRRTNPIYKSFSQTTSAAAVQLVQEPNSCLKQSDETPEIGGTLSTARPSMLDCEQPTEWDEGTEVFEVAQVSTLERRRITMHGRPAAPTYELPPSWDD